MPRKKLTLERVEQLFIKHLSNDYSDGDKSNTPKIKAPKDIEAICPLGVFFTRYTLMFDWYLSKDNKLIPILNVFYGCTDEEEHFFTVEEFKKSVVYEHLLNNKLFIE